MPSPTNLYVAVIGVGGVGSAFISQLNSLPSALRPALIYASSSKKAVFSPDYAPVSFSSAALAASSTAPLDPAPLRRPPRPLPSGRPVVVDNASNQSIADSCPTFLRAGISVVTPNKKAFSSSLQ